MADISRFPNSKNMSLGVGTKYYFIRTVKRWTRGQVKFGMICETDLSIARYIAVKVEKNEYARKPFLCAHSYSLPLPPLTYSPSIPPALHPLWPTHRTARPYLSSYPPSNFWLCAPFSLTPSHWFLLSFLQSFFLPISCTPSFSHSFTPSTASHCWRSPSRALH